MTEIDPTPEQDAVINARDGIVVVDAGAGTGKTYTITQRYAHLLEREGVGPEDILLVTFTRNAASEARERIVSATPYSMAALRQAPINTFHGICNDVVREHGFDAPAIMGIDEHITGSTQLLEDEIIESDRFRTFFRSFTDRNPEHTDISGLITDESSVLSLIRQLAAKGVFPTADGWFRNGRSALEGNFEAFEQRFREANEPNDGARGPTQSDLRATLSGFDRDRCYRPDAPSEQALRGGNDRKRIDTTWAEQAFDEDRDSLFRFVHDVYLEYVKYALGRNYLNFSFLQMFAFMLLHEDHELRTAIHYPHVIVDEFQDTSELQFKITLLLGGRSNLCVVGDWKQSIYGFQYAAVENIQSFEQRLVTFTDQLNRDVERVTYAVDAIERISLTDNFRSTQPILDLAEEALGYPARTQGDGDPDILDEIIPLDSQVPNLGTQIEAIQSEDQVDAVLTKIREIVGSDQYAVRAENGTTRVPEFDDIAVLTRKRSFGRELRSRASEVGLPVAYEGGVELFGTDQAILLLAWLRILEDPNDRRGWAVVLEDAGYTLDEIDSILEARAYPAAFRSFRERLNDTDRIGTTARLVFDRYGYRDVYADTIVAVLEDTYEVTGRTRGGIVRYIEESIEAGTTHEVADSLGRESVTVQTIHAAKGLEYPIVILADMSRHRFPAHRGRRTPIRFTDPIGLRQARILDNPHGHFHSYDNWRYQILSATLRGEYAEERRLLYVAMTRARDHLICSASSDPSPFFDALPLDTRVVEPSLDVRQSPSRSPSQLDVTVPPSPEPIQLTAHDLIDDSVFEDQSGGRGTAFGEQLHEFAERYANGEETPSRSTPDERAIRSFLDTRSGELRPEIPVILPLEVDGTNVTISGTIDLLHLTDEFAEIIDYKTDTTDLASMEYRKQLSVYYHVVAAVMPDRNVTVSLFYTRKDEPNEILPLERGELVDEVRRVLN